MKQVQLVYQTVFFFIQGIKSCNNAMHVLRSCSDSCYIVHDLVLAWKRMWSSILLIGRSEMNDWVQAGWLSSFLKWNKHKQHHFMHILYYHLSHIFLWTSSKLWFFCTEQTTPTMPQFCSIPEWSYECTLTKECVSVCGYMYVGLNGNQTSKSITHTQPPQHSVPLA